MPVKKLGRDAMEHIASCRGRVPASAVARHEGVSKSWVYKLRGRCGPGGAPPEPRPMGRPRRHASPDDAAAAASEYAARPAGVVRIVKRLRADGKPKVPCLQAYRTLAAAGAAGRVPARSRRRKWISLERKYSSAMRRVDWHDMKHPSPRGMRLVAYLDDASRCITGFGLFRDATAENTVMILRAAQERFGVPGQILSDHGTQFTASRRGEPRGSWRPTLFEQELTGSSTSHIMARVRHPQTNGKTGRFFRTLEEVGHWGSVARFIEHCNEDRLHFALDTGSGEVPLQAFRRRRAGPGARAANPKWMEEAQ